MYSLTDRKTFNNIENWLKQINQHHPENISRIIVGNKADCSPAERQVTTEEGQQLASKYGIKHIETSAKDNINITELFQTLAKEIRENLKEEINYKDGKKPGAINLNEAERQQRDKEKKGEKKKCC